MKNLIIYLTIAIASQGLSQSNDLNSFIPEGYILTEKHIGDLNKDGKEDCVLLIKKVDTTNIVMNRFDEKVDRNRRGLIILFAEENGYHVVKENLDCFASENEDGGIYFPPELTIEIKNSKLYIHFGHGRYGYWMYTFRFQNSNFELIGYDMSDNFGSVVNREVSINFLTKKKLTKVNTNENADGGDEVFEETWSKVSIDQLIKLSEIQDFYELKMHQY